MLETSRNAVGPPLNEHSRSVRAWNRRAIVQATASQPEPQSGVTVGGGRVLRVTVAPSAPRGFLLGLKEESK
jgi:hypothetical protein